MLRTLCAAALACVLATAAEARDPFKVAALVTGAPTTSRACLTPATREVLEAADARFGVVFALASTCRPGARMTFDRTRESYHASGRAADLIVPRALNVAAVARWLHGRTPGLVMTYAGMPRVVHFDVGSWHALRHH